MDLIKNSFSKKKSFKQKGQITLFGLLTFPILFCCLAMVINVGMVVHDKINLQNAVDLAAIYAAQKQAETLDAMAHINYQIRQSYKLLAWRYLILGSLGAHWKDADGTGYTEYIDILRDTGGDIVCPNYGSSCSIGSGQPRQCTSQELKNSCPYAVCVFHPQFITPLTDTTHLCQRAVGNVSGIQLPETVTGTGGGVQLSNMMVTRARDQIFNTCNSTGFGNWLAATSMYLSFFFDQFERRKFIEEVLFGKIIAQGRDTTGQFIETGVENTIKKNLTYINHEAFDEDLVKLTNSAKGKSFSEFFDWESIWFDINYIQNTQDISTAGSANSGCLRTMLSIFDCLSTPPGIDTGAFQRIEGHDWCKNLKTVVEANVSPPTSGFYKKDSSNFTVQVEVTLNYKGQIFFPLFGNMQLTAKAKAKPFGARFGPPQGMDEHLPKGTVNDNTIPNYSRHVGDTFGLFAANEQKFWSQVLIPNTSDVNQDNTDGRTLNNYQDFVSHYLTPPGSTTPLVNDPMMIPLENTTTGFASNYDDIFITRMRIFEDIAISPDKFDLTFYTILPNYMTSLYQKLKYRNNVINENDYVPADLGHLPHESESSKWVTNFTEQQFHSCYNDRKTETQRDRPNGPHFWMNYIEKQILCANSELVSRNPLHGEWITHRATSINDLLTSWSAVPPNSVREPSELYENFLLQECENGDDTEVSINFNELKLEELKLLPSHCVAKGGRTGFSVKLISSE